MGSIHGSGRCPGGRHGNCLQYSCLENPMDRGAWRAVCRKQLDTTCSRASRLNGNNILVTQQRPVGSTCHQTHPLFLPDFLGSGLEHERERDCLQCQMGERRGTYHVLGPFHQFASECRDWQKTVRHEWGQTWVRFIYGPMTSLHLCEISQVWDRGNNDYLIELWGCNIKTTLIIIMSEFSSLR